MTTQTHPTGPLDHEFSAMLQKSPTKNAWTYVVMPDSAKFFKTAGLVNVRGTMDGEEFETSFIALGDGTHKLPIKTSIRSRINKQTGNKIVVHLHERLSH